MWGEHTHISMVEYWRWWVVHLWVEGFFEVFATAVIAFLFTKLGLIRGQPPRPSTCCSRPSCSCSAASSAPAPPVLHRHTDLGDRARRQLLGAGSGAAGADRLEAYDYLLAQPGHAVDGALSLADPVLPGGRVSGTWSAPACSAS
jgi:hypothetical protein